MGNQTEHKDRAHAENEWRGGAREREREMKLLCSQTGSLSQGHRICKVSVFIIYLLVWPHWVLIVAYGI